MRYLVVGYGNSLCGDDGLGPAVAELLGQVISPQLAASTTILSLQQLDITLASQLPHYSAVIFVDAQLSNFEHIREQQRVSITKLIPVQEDQAENRQPMGFSAHFLNPQDLMKLAVQLYKTCPPAWLVAVCAYQIEVGRGLSTEAQENALLATQELHQLLEQFH